MSTASATLRLLIFAIITIAMTQMVFSSTAHAQSTPGDALFVTGSVDNERPYLGQQITYTFKIYQQSGTSLASGGLRYEAPGFAGFWNSQKTEQDEYTEILNFIEYRVVELRTVLFPSVVGAVAIDPAALATSTVGASVDSRLESDAVAMEVRPLPAGAPSSFSGAVGRFEVSAVSDGTEGKVNEPVRLTFRISGEGNIEALPDPEWPEFAGWRVIESPVSSESRVEAGVMTGSRTYEFTLVPEIEGKLTIPEIQYPHFDPVSGQYIQVGSSPISVTVAGGEGLPPASQPTGEETTGDDEAALRPIKDIPVSLRRGGSELTGSVVYWAVWAVPVLIVTGALVWRRRRASQEAARAETLRNSALPNAQASLARARSAGEDNRIAASEAVLSYVSTRLETPASGLTREALLRRLRDAGVSQELEDRVGEVLTEGESARYTPPTAISGTTGNRLERASQILSDLEEAIRA